MCHICGLLEDTWPGPKNLARAIMESNVPQEHIEEILANVTKDLDAEETYNLAKEMYMEALRLS